MKIQIEVADGIIPEGWEAVAFRVTLADEWCIDKDGALMQSMGRLDGPRLIVRQIVKAYNWERTLRWVLVKGGNGNLMPLGDCRHPTKWLSLIWQPNLDGKCPVDPEASIVRVMTSDGKEFEDLAANIKTWHAQNSSIQIVAWKFVRLADNYEF